MQRLITKVGPVKVNDVAQLTIKTIQLRLIEQTLQQATSSQQRFNALLSQGDLHSVLSEYNSVMCSLQLALQIPSIDKKLQVLVQQRIGCVHLANAQYDIALAVFLETLQLNLDLHGQAKVTKSRCLIGDAYARLGKFLLAL